jgi:hypothetical protein
MRFILRVFAPVAAMLLLPALAAAQERLAIKGYDPVAYFTEAKPTPGDPALEHVWQGARWRFASAANRAMFVSDPDRFAPQYAGYCAMGIAMGKKVEVDPDAWTIVDGKLYINYATKIVGEWRNNQAENIAKADVNWSKLR